MTSRASITTLARLPESSIPRVWQQVRNTNPSGDTHPRPGDAPRTTRSAKWIIQAFSNALRS